MLRRPISPWLPTLFVLVVGAYLLPQTSVSQEQAAAAPQGNFTLPQTLSPTMQAQFEAARPATVRIRGVNPRTRQGGEGTGFFMSAAGEILTAYHVVSGAQLLMVTTLDKKNYRARLVGYDDAADLAVLQVETKQTFPFLPRAARPPRVNEKVLAIGNSGGDFLQPRHGKLLRLEATSERADFPQGTLEMDAPLNVGDSGGPILNEAGQAVGVVSYIRQDNTGITRRSYAVPVDVGNSLVAELRAGAKKEVGVIGVQLDPYHSGVTDPAGGIIAEVTPKSPAAKVGLRGNVLDNEGRLSQFGDVILQVQGQRTEDASEVIRQLRKYKVGDTVQVEVLRDGKKIKFALTLVSKSSLGL